MEFRNVSDDVLIAYVKDDKRTFNRLMIDDAGRVFVEDLMSTCSVNSKLRERAVAKILGLRHNLDVNGWDAKDIKGRSWEIKTEQKNDLVRGVFKWHLTSDINLDLYKKQPLVYAAFTPSGKCIFILGFLIKDTPIIAKIKHLRKMAINFNIYSFFQKSIVYYCNPKFLSDKYIVPSLLEKIEDYVEDFEDEK